jgi:TetR/AcrR family transcriptional repressor of nem operon
MAGVKQFDREEVLHCALEVFWQRGYKATSIQDLIEATGIGRGSLYATFGDKEKLFLMVLDRYVDKVAASLMTALNAPDPRLALECMFKVIIDRMSNLSYPRGCLTTNTCLECPDAGDKINRKLAENLGEMETAIYQVLLRAQAEGSLAPGRDIRALARFFVGVTQGMAVMNKTLADPSVLRDIAKTALSVWDVPVM